MKYINKSFVIKLILFLFFLFVSNFFLLKPGLWLYQDAAGWSKNLVEAYHAINEHLVIFGPGYSNYYLSYDKGILVFLGLVHPIYSFLLIFLFGAESSQTIFIISGYVLAFFSFYLFSGIFFKDNNIRYFLSLIYTFNPLSFSTQGAVYLLAGIPLYMYSFYKCVNDKKSISLKWLLLNIVSAYLMISYVRFALINFVILIVYLYFLLRDISFQKFKRLIVLFLIYLLVFLPFAISIFFHLTEKSETAVFYTQLFSNLLPRFEMYQAFNLLQSFNLKLYSSNLWILIGLAFFAYFLYLSVQIQKKHYSVFVVLNMFLLLLGISLFSFGRIFPAELHHHVINLFPFISNGSEWALFITLIPFILLLGYISQFNKIHVYLFSLIFVTVSIIPLLNTQDFQLKKYSLHNIPRAYDEYFIEPYIGISKPTYYIPDMCWRARYMDEADTPTQCINKGIKYSTIALSNPRVLSGDDYYFSIFLQKKADIDNLRITHNLKNIIIPDDLVPAKGPGPLINSKEVAEVKQINNILKNNENLNLKSNVNFNHYFYKDMNNYDFLLYSPGSFSFIDEYTNLLTNAVSIDRVPVFASPDLKSRTAALQQAGIKYKFDPLNPTVYYIMVDITNLDDDIFLQLNQTFSENWRLKLIDKNIYESNKCKTKYTFYKITNNSSCDISLNIYGINILKNLLERSVIDADQFKGNILGNLWLIKSSDLKKYHNENKLYLVLVYEKQLYYTISLIISISTVLFIILMITIQEIFIKTKKHDKY